MGEVLSTIYTENFKCVSTSDEYEDNEFVILSRPNTEIVTIESETDSDSESIEPKDN